MTEKFTVEGQEASSKEVVLESKEGNETPSNLEPENGEKSLQNLENAEAIVAQDDGLEAALNESRDVIDAEFREVDESPELEQVLGEPFGTDLETAMAVGTGTVKDFPPLSPAQVEVLGKAMRRFAEESTPSLGLQPDGSTKVVVSIQEGYWDAVQQWAESDGVPVEQWLSNRLYEYISTYGEPAGKR